MNDAPHSNRKVQMVVKIKGKIQPDLQRQSILTDIHSEQQKKKGKNGYQPIPGRASNEATDSAATGGSSSIDPDHFEWTAAHLLSPNPPSQFSCHVIQWQPDDNRPPANSFKKI